MTDEPEAVDESRTVLARALLARPDLWWAALGVLWRLVPSRWWRHGAHLPVPARAWWRFRMVTAYGRPEARPRSREVIAYLEWCRSTAPRGHRSRHRRGIGEAGHLDVRRSG